MNIINQIFYTVKRQLVDIKPILTKLASFIVIILILGSAFSSAFEASDLEAVKIVYLNNDSGEYGNDFIEAMINVEAIKSLVEFEKATTFEEAERMVNDDKAEAFIYIPNEFSAQATKEAESKVIDVYRKKYSGINATIVQTVVDSFINGINTAGVIYKMTGSLENFEFSMGEGLKDEPLTDSDFQPTAMGYYAVAMLLMLILYGADYGNMGVGEEYLGVLGDRIKLSPLKPFEQYAGKIIGLSLVTFLSAIVVILFTNIVYGVDWGDNIGLVLLVTFTYSVLTTTLGAMLCILTKDILKANSFVSLAIIGFTFLAGGFVVMDFGKIQYFSPSYYAKTAIFNTVYNGDNNIVYQNIGIMWVITLAFAVVSIFAARRKQA